MANLEIAKFESERKYWGFSSIAFLILAAVSATNQNAAPITILLSLLSIMDFQIAMTIETKIVIIKAKNEIIANMKGIEWQQ